MDLITPAEFERKMKEVAEIKDAEDRHRKADAILVETLNSMGYQAGTEIFKKMGKWYA